MRRLYRGMRGLLVACLLVATSCAGAGEGRAPASPSATTGAWTADPDHVFVVPTATAAAERCARAAQVEEVLRRFTAAFDSGVADAIERALSPELWAVALTVGGKAEAAYGRDDAVRYLIGRSRAGDRLFFVRARINDLAGWDGAAQFGPVAFRLERAGAAIDLSGKGALYCGGPARGIKVLGLVTRTLVSPTDGDVSHMAPGSSS